MIETQEGFWLYQTRKPRRDVGFSDTLSRKSSCSLRNESKTRISASYADARNLLDIRSSDAEKSPHFFCASFEEEKVLLVRTGFRTLVASSSSCSRIRNISAQAAKMRRSSERKFSNSLCKLCASILVSMSRREIPCFDKLRKNWNLFPTLWLHLRILKFLEVNFRSFL